MHEVLRTVKMDIKSELSKKETESINKTCSDYSLAYCIFATEICDSNLSGLWHLSSDCYKYWHSHIFR